MNILAPWEEGSHPWEEHGKYIDTLRKKLVAITEPYLADKVIELVKKRGGISSLWGFDTSTEQKYVLFNVNGALWQEDRKQTMIETLDEAGSDSNIHNNAYEMVRMLSYGLNKGIGACCSQEQLQEIIKNKEIARSIWNACISRPIQYRGYSKFREIREQFVNIAGTDEYFTWPDWLEKEGEKE